MEVRTCQNCKNNFAIEPEDFTFYEKIKVPPPTFCPKCRRQRRLAWRNDLTFYNRTCDLCKKGIISLYSPDKSVTVYCNKCWWSDSWDASDYGREYDSSRSFFEQWNELKNTVPLLALVNDNGVGSVNCDYTQNVTFAKNCYMGSMSWKNEDCMYYYHVAGPETREVVDSNDIFLGSERIYDSIFLEHCYNCREAYYSASDTDCAFIYDCRGCSNCFLSVGLRNKNYYILNQPYAKEEYEEILKSYRLDTYSGAANARLKFLEHLAKYPMKYADIRNSSNCTGNALFNCKNTQNSFTARKCEDVKYFESGNEIKDSYDLCTGGESSLCYEGLTPDNDYRALFTIFCLKNQDVEYCQDCHSSKNLLGCVSMKRREFCILNKKYDKETYLQLRAQIVKDMTARGEYGEFFPIGLSTFGYNETMAQEYYPLTREEVLARGWKWQDKVQFTKGKETVKSEDLPDSIGEVPAGITNDILACTTCSRNYRIIHEELAFYRKMRIPLPRECFYCRNAGRLKFRNPYELWKRTCAKCGSGVETPYSPDRPEIVYCEQCYQQEVV